MFIAFLAAPLGQRRSQSPLQTLRAECQALMIPQVIVWKAKHDFFWVCAMFEEH